MTNTIKTPRGTFTVQQVFANATEAKQAGYYYYFTNDDGAEIMTKHIGPYENHSVHFAIVVRA